MRVAAKVFILLSIAFTMVAFCSSKEKFGCDNSDDLQDTINPEELKLNFSGDIKVFEDVDILSIASTANNNFDKLYIDARLEDDEDQTNLIIFTTHHFKQYIREQTSTNIFLNINFDCPGGTKRTLLFVQPLKEGNYFPPEFNKRSYVFVVPTPLYKGFELTIFEKISATDYDLTGNDITFSSTDSEDFNIVFGTLEKQEKKTLASLKLQSILLSLTEDIEFSIIATDSGKPPRSSSPTKVTITSDRSNSLPPIPAFTRTLVYGSLTEDLQLNELELVLNPDTYSSDVSFQKLTDEEDIFEITNIDNVVYVSLAKQLDKEFIKERERLTLVVEATNAKLKESGRTAVSVLLPRKQDCRFKEVLYHGKLIDKLNVLEIDDIEIIANTNDLNQMDFELEGELKHSFEIKRYQNIIKLSLKHDLNPNVWANITCLSLKLSTNMDSEEIASTVIVIDVTHTKLWFENSTFFGSISVDGNLVLDPINLFSNEDNTDDVNIQLLQIDAELFLFERNGNKISFKLKENIQSELENKTLFRFEIEAEEMVTGAKAVSTVLIGRLVEQKEYRFEEGIYKGKLIVKSKALEIDDIEIIANANDLKQMDFELEGESQESFEINRFQNIIQLSLKPGLNPKIWTNITYISLKLFAKMDTDEVASTAIVIDVSHTKLWFEYSTFSGLISSEGSLVLDPIKLFTNQDNTDDVNIQLLQTDAELFLFEKKGNEIRLKLKENIQSELENKTLFRFEIEAEEIVTGVKAVSTVLIGRTVEEKEYRFEEGLYKGKLMVKSNALEIDDFEMFAKPNDFNEMDFELDGEFKQSFEIKRYENIIKLSHKPDVNPKEWANISCVSLKLLAKLDTEEIASTVIIIDVVYTTLLFEKSTFFGSINIDGHLVLDSIKLFTNEDNTDDVHIQLLQTDAELFLFERSGNEINLKLKENIQSELENKTLLWLEVEAEEVVTGVKAVCTVLIGRIVEEKEYRFKKGLYKGILMVKSNALKIDDIEIITSPHDRNQLDFELHGEFKQSFEIKRHESNIQLSLKPDSNPSIWANITYISLKISANVDTEEVASTVVIIDAVHTKIWFDKSIYFGSISSDDNLVLDPIRLFSNEENTDDINVQLLQTDAELFLFQKSGNEISLKLRDNIQSELENKTLLRLEIEAKEIVTGAKAVCAVLIGRTVEGKVMKFEKNIYEAEIRNDSKLIDVDVSLDKESYTEDTSISISGQYAEHFNFEQIENKISLSLKETFNSHDYYNVSYLWLEVKASSLMKKLDTWTVVIFRIVQEVTPEFEEQAYFGTITKSNVLEVPKLLLKKPTLTNSTFVELIGNYSNYFDCYLTENELHISLKSELPDDVKVHTSIVLLVHASNGHSRGSTTVVVNLPFVRSLSNIFKKIIQSGKVTQNETVQELDMPDIEFMNDYNVADFDCKLVGDEVMYFDYSVVSPKNVLKLSLSSQIPEDIMLERFYLIISLECQHKENDLRAGSTILFLTLPGTNGCPTPDPPTFIPEFPKPFYNFYAKPTFVGSLQKVRATIRESDDEIRYFLDISNEHLRSRLDIDSDSGEVFITAIISAGTYFFKIGAENVVTQGQSKVNCRLDIEPLIQCDDHAVVSNTLLVKYLEEETAHDDILNAKVGDCMFKIFAIEPSNQEYVDIDPLTNVLKMIPTDRENFIFANMTVPQIEVKLKLNCFGDNNFPSQRSVRDLSEVNSVSENRSLVFTDDIIFAKDVTILSIILTDINDNYPEFLYPKHERLIVGFPRDENLIDLFSECIVQVAAVDKDQGLNKEIRYSIEPNGHFQIDSKTGKVYPRGNAMSGINEIDIIVYATDRDGGSDGLSSNLTLTVKVLTADHFTLVSFESEQIESVETLIESANNRTGLNLVLVRHATVSLANESVNAYQRIFDAESNRFIRKLWVYAFEGNVPIRSKVIKQLLTGGESSGIISAQTVEEVFEVVESITPMGSYDVTYYIYGLGCLSIILVICIGFIAWKYIYSHQKKSKDDNENNLTSRGPTNPNFNLKQGAEINIQKQTQILSDMVSEPSYYARRESMKILGTTTQESTDDERRIFNQNVNGSVHEMSYETESESSNGSSNESLRPRATVTFNELVQRIHIDDVKIKS